jgi:hypothetical protein
MSTESALLYYFFLRIIDKHPVRACLNTGLAAITFLLIHQHYAIIALIDGFNRARFQAWRLTTVHTGHRQIIHTKLRILTFRCIPIRDPHCFDSNSRAYFHIILCLAGYLAGLTTGAPFEVNDQPISFSQFLLFLGFLHFNQIVIVSRVGNKYRLLYPVNLTMSQGLVATFNIFTGFPPLRYVDHPRPDSLVNPDLKLDPASIIEGNNNIRVLNTAFFCIDRIHLQYRLRV